MASKGSSRETTTFLKDLRAHNSKEWFHDHYDDYQVHLLEPAIAFVKAIGPLLRRFSPNPGGAEDRGIRDADQPRHPLREGQAPL